jgi:hypothetical protein
MGYDGTLPGMFKVLFSDEAGAILNEITGDLSLEKKAKKIRKAVGYLELNPRHPGLQTHKYQSLRGPGGEEVFEAYVENDTPSAWRIWFWYGPEPAQITILTIGPHPD